MVVLSLVTRGNLAHASVSSDILNLTGGRRVKVVWEESPSGGSEGWGVGSYYVLKGFDTNDGSVRTIKGTVDNYSRPTITHDGARIVYSDQDSVKVYIVNWDGSGRREIASGYASGLWYDAGSGKQYAIVAKGSKSRGGSYPFYRINVDNSGDELLLWNKTEVTPSWMAVSSDCKRLGGSFPWDSCGVATLPNGTYTEYGKGCFSVVTPDTTYRCCIFDGAHENWRVYSAPGSYKNLLLFGGQTCYYPMFSNEARYMTITGPINWPGKVYFQKLESDLSAVTGRVAVTGTGNYAWPYAWVGGAAPPPNQPPSASISSPSDGATFTAGDTLSYSGSGSDPEDGSLSGGSLSWEIDRNGDGLGPVHTSTGGSGSYTFPSDLTQDTTYTVKLTATDSKGATDSVTHTITVAPGSSISKPSVTAKDATNVTANSARLNGEVTSTGGENPNVILFWGDNDGAGDASAWDNEVPLGSKGAGAFYRDLSGLTPNTTYYYCFYASNSAGGMRSATVGFKTTGVPAVSVPFRMNCGVNSYTPSGWAEDDGYVSGGSDFDSWPNAIDATGVPNAAPAQVYETVRHVGPHTYTIPVANGDYVVRLHSCEGWSATTSRDVRYVIEGVTVADHMDYAAEAGGHFKAMVKDFSVTVTDGDIVVECTDYSDTDVFEAGIEILASGGPVNESPEVDAGPDVSITTDQAAWLDATVTDDGLPSGTLTYAWTVTSGPADVTFGSPDACDTTATFTEPGEYLLRLTASDGALSDYDEVTVTVTDPGVPSITITSPEGSEVWYVGTTRRIRWTTENLDNIAAHYSTDGGKTLTLLIDTMFATDTDWGDYAWSVPDEPSANCVVSISGYFGECPTTSGVFEIRAVTDSDGDGMDDGWESSTFGDLSHDETTDADGDGLTDYVEFVNGTDPLSGDSAPGSAGFGCLPVGQTGATAVLLFGAAVLLWAGARDRR